MQVFDISMRATASSCYSCFAFHAESSDHHRRRTKAVSVTSPSVTAWRTVKANEREEMRTQEIMTLTEEGVPPVAQDVFRWRMDQALRHAAKHGERD